MTKVLIGFVLGIAVCTVGLSGIFKLFDNGVAKVQQVTKEAAQ